MGKNMGKNTLLIKKHDNYRVICIVVPPRRVELRIDPYHGSVIPIN